MAVKRKRSTASLSTSPGLSSPASSVSSTSACYGADLSREETYHQQSSEFHSRTMKRWRDNRPREEVIYGWLASLLYICQCTAMLMVIYEAENTLSLLYRGARSSNYLPVSSSLGDSLEIDGQGEREMGSRTVREVSEEVELPKVADERQPSLFAFWGRLGQTGHLRKEAGKGVDVRMR